MRRTLRARQAVQVCVKRYCSTSSLTEIGHLLLRTSDPLTKVKITHDARIKLENNEIKDILDTKQKETEPIPSPARPEKPNLVPKREIQTPKNAGVSLPVYLLHALAHIELNAVDLCWDTMLRATSHNLPREFYLDWLSVADDEARHFQYLHERLIDLNSHYGALNAHDSLLQDAEATKDDFIARIGVIQLVHEARGLDSWDRLVSKLKNSGDHKSASIMNTICFEEIGHVKIGVKWFTHLCKEQNLDPIPHFHSIVTKLNLRIPPPFNQTARLEAGMTPEWYLPVQLERKVKQK
eukprot:TRINITY_DN12145_c0_g1_i1.p1 TRINITY_DN12145_c0_g1~~TRINITY_DN12145_c0_g1_i1.p1  ORF type:complete len:295 (+),score=26.31 TRINITY_DN12145_c0_g1_i1:40-924(+)